ncbi:MAG: TIM barrel protein [Candidatus Lokiarchaeota archaeon]|nr:TIM barrel protein [Candidatus Lokiarchaeota archaeon]
MKIAFNTYSFRKEWALMTMGGSYQPVIDYIKLMDDVDEVEMLDRTFNSDPKILKKAIEAFGEHGIKIFSLGPHPHPLVGKSSRPEAIKELKHWTDIAADNGIHKFRLSLGGGKSWDKKMGLIPKKPRNTAEAVEWTVEVLKPALEYAQSRDVTLCIETHHRYSSNPDYQEKLLDALQSKHLGFIYDIGNYENDKLRWDSLDLLIKKNAIKYMHAKTYTFDENGLETTLDYPRAIKLMHDAGIDINLSIEWEGRIPAPLGVLKTYELCKYSIAKAEGKDYQIKTDLPDPDELMDKLLGD